MKNLSLGNSKKEDDENVEQLEDENKNILLSMISQLRPGMDLTRVTLPTFVLEPKSMLERITNFMSHPEFLLPIPTFDDPEKRFIEVVRFYLSGFHILPPGVKKPLNPILGEHFTCKWKFEDGSESLYLAEQVSHHPPMSAYFYMNPEHHIRIDGLLKPRSKFLGNSAGTIMEGRAILTLLNHDNEEYIITQPNMYARGILFGRMKFELGDHSWIRCEKTDLICDLEFKVKGFISGTYNAIVGKIRRNSPNSETLYEITGKWNEEMWVKNLKTGEKELLFNAHGAKYTPCSVRPLQEQEDRESRKLWNKVTGAIIKRDQTTATDAKSAIEDRQREEARTRDADGITWQPRFFKQVDDSFYILNHKIDTSLPPHEVKAKIESISRISPMSEGPPSLPPSSPTIPPHNSQGKSTVPPNSTDENTLISFDDDSDEFVDAQE